MNSSDIDAIFVSLPDLRSRWLGVHGSDFVLKLSVSVGGLSYCDDEGGLILKLPKLLILNSDESGDPGSHWLAMYIPEKGPLEFFDPLGRGPGDYQDFLKYWLESSERLYVRNAYRYQDVGSSACGQFCIFYGVLRLMGLTMTDIISCLTPHNLGENERIIADFMSLFSY